MKIISGDKFMKKLSVPICLLIALLIVSANVACAEDGTRKGDQKAEDTSIAEVVVTGNAASSTAMPDGKDDTEKNQLPDRMGPQKIGKDYRFYFNPDEQDADIIYSNRETDKESVVQVNPVMGKETIHQNASVTVLAQLDQQNPGAADSSVSAGQGESLQKNMQESTFIKKEGSTLQMDKIDMSSPRPRRLEASYSFDYLDPNDLYGNWHAAQLSFYDTVTPDFTYFLQGVVYDRDEGNGALGIIGAYKGWTPKLYTCTSVSAGTHKNYLPAIRFDHDFNFSVWPGQGINFLMGLSYLDYHDDHSGWIFSGGPMMTFDKFNLLYRLFYNISNPGTVSSFSHLISLGYGREGWQWTYLNVSFGKQAYLATFVVPQEVNQNSFSINLRHRHWLDKYYGVFGDVSYTKLEDGYEKYGVGFGAFYAF